MIKAIAFDFDGVILDSADIKTEAFGELFSAYPEHLDAILSYHVDNAGISRFVKFAHIYQKILDKPYSEASGIALSQQFSDIVLAKVLQAPMIVGVEDFLEKNKESCPLFIITGTPLEEMLYILDERELAGFFTEVHGVPETKEAAMQDIIGRYCTTPDELLYFGDALSDYRAAQTCGTRFIGIGGKAESVFLSTTICYRDFTSIGDLS